MPELDDRNDIMAETGSLSDDYVKNNIKRWWDGYVGDDNQFLRTKRRVLLYLWGKASELVDRTVGQDKVAASQKFAHISAMLKDCDAELLGGSTRAGSVTPTMAARPPETVISGDSG
jgi:hypothetical protein